jgi:hypothetical protein
MEVNTLEARWFLRRGQRIVIGFYVTFILSAIAWASVWGLKGTTFVERVFGKLPVIVLTIIPLVPSVVCLVLLLLLQGW